MSAPLSRTILRWSTGLVMVLLVLGPIYWIVSSSFKNPREIIQATPSLWPQEIYLGNYMDLFQITPYPTYLTNSILVALFTALITTIVSTMAGYAMYRLRVPGSGWLGRVILLAYMVPATLLLVPIYASFASARLIDSMLSLVIVNVAFTAPFCVWLLRGFFDAIPKELDEAAAADGAGPLTTLRKVIMPLLLPGLATIGLYAFIFSWTEFVFASQLIVSDDLKTLPIGLGAMMGQYNVNWGLLMAGASMTMLPAVVLFAAVGRYFVRGLTAGAVHGQ